MPRDGISTEWLEQREEDLALLITAKDVHLDGIRRLADLLRRRDLITDAYHQDMRDSIDAIAAALLVGKRNTAQLRTKGE